MTQKSRVEVDAVIEDLIADNSEGLISPADMRSVLDDVVDSVTWYDEAAAGGDDMTGAEIIAAVEAEASADKLSFVESLFEKILDNDTLFGTNSSSAVVAFPYVVATGASSRVWTFDSGGDFLLQTFDGLKVDLSGSLTGAIYSTAGVWTAKAIYGVNQIFLPAAAWKSRATSGCAALATVETATNKWNVEVLGFDASADEFAQCVLYLPKCYNASTVTANFLWTHPATTTNFSVTWAIRARVFTDDDALDQAAGTAQLAVDEGGTTLDYYRSPATSAVTLGGTPAKDRLCYLEIYRDVDGNGTSTNDDLAVDAQFIGLLLNTTTDAATDD